MAQPTNAPLIWVVVLALNNYADTAECLASLRQLAYPNYRVVLVDNGSTDGTAQHARQQFPEVTIIENGQNLWVAGGYNVGFRYGLAQGAEYLLMLNNDTTVDPALLSQLVAAATPNSGILVPIVYYYDNPARIWSAGARYRRFPPAIVFETAIRPAGQRQLEYAIGCGILIARRAFEQVGLFDENFRYNWEDHDFARRVYVAGLAITQVPAARMWHKISRTSRPGSALFWEVHGESGAIFFRRHGKPAYLSLALHMGYFGLREIVAKRRWQFARPFLRGLRLGLTRPLRAVPRVKDGLSYPG